MQYNRAKWSGIISALEVDKIVANKDGCPVLTKKGKSLLDGPRDMLVATKALKEALGLEEVGKEHVILSFLSSCSLYVFVASSSLLFFSLTHTLKEMLWKLCSD